jgi:hypothetical protein
MLEYFMWSRLGIVGENIRYRGYHRLLPKVTEFFTYRSMQEGEITPFKWLKFYQMDAVDGVVHADSTVFFSLRNKTSIWASFQA